ncbi:preprotein translocase subunit SecA [Rhizobium laguerreae]|uniref:preprotein translocase subunit SecA n=1 Tax=Rhizobium laguerreae TaxID=1076926 RepID=UPI001C912627|nr:preprotein translocase subunit SecA [Rhizobium laguerreae]MBY3155243.1 preprotein translocase subunit SecA [Rhizobium laguerreae]
MLNALARFISGAEIGIGRRGNKDLAAINSLSDDCGRMSDDEFREKTSEFQRRIDAGEQPEGKLRHEAFAVVREAAYRVLGKRPYDVQVIGGLILNDGRIAEMRTGEGKTLTAAMPTYLNALSGKGVHVITVNDYLAARDAEQIGKVHRFLGLSVGVILSGMEDQARREAYRCDITYGTNNEFGFDYLRDNLRFDASQMVQRGHNFVIVDEVDSVLIDEARTPLIISAPVEDSSDIYIKVDAIIASLRAPQDFAVDEKMRACALTETGADLVEAVLRDQGLLAAGVPLYDHQAAHIVHHVNCALKARALFARDKDYVVKDGQVVIVDESTGRMMDGRRFSDGIHQALEAKEGVRVQNETATLSSITYQNYFRMYKKLSGMTGTAATEREEFAEVYGLAVTEVPTHRPVARIDESDEVHLTADAKFKAIVETVREARMRLQPVLIGTASIEKSELMAEYLRRGGFVEGDFADIPKGRPVFQVLNARNHQREAEIIAKAGIPGAVTIATNMAGRGTDIELGGSLQSRLESELGGIEDSTALHEAKSRIEHELSEARQKVKEAGGLLVLGTERHESRRVDNQLRGRAGRQGDPGRSRFFVSFEDDIVRIFASDKLGRTARTLGLAEGDAISHPLISKLLEGAQKKVEQRNYDIRRDLVKFDNVNNVQREAIHEYRKDIMGTSDVAEIVDTMRERAVRAAIEGHIPENGYPETWDMKGLADRLRELTSLDFPTEEWAGEDGVSEEEVFERVWKEIAADEDERRNSFDVGVFEYARKHTLLQSFDTLWREHLAGLETLKGVINFRSYAQREPIVEYRTDAYHMFEDMLERIAEEVTKLSSRIISTKPGAIESPKEQAA